MLARYLVNLKSNSGNPDLDTLDIEGSDLTDMVASIIQNQNDDENNILVAAHMEVQTAHEHKAVERLGGNPAGSSPALLKS